MRRGGCIVGLVLSLSAFARPASAFSLRSEVDARKLGTDDQVQLTITLEGSDGPAELALPPLVNLDLVGGPYQSTQVSIVNGRMSQSRSFSYVLRPRAAGKAEVGPVKAGDQTAPAIPLEVVAGSVRPREPQRRPDPFGMDPFAQDPFGDPFERLLGGRRARRAEPKLLVEQALSRTRVRVGEPLVLTYYLYTQTSVSAIQPKEAPQYGGFWAEDLETPKAGPSGEPASVGGESYHRFALGRKLLFPTKAGALTLPAASFQITLPQQGFFDNGAVVVRSTKPLAITVEPLPEAPGFSGAVGRFRATASLDRDRVPFGEAATLRFRVEGTGNLKWIDKGPELALRGAKVYPPQTKSEFRATPEGIAGSRSWEFVVVPQTSGTVEIPPLGFAWFDPAAGRIVTTETKALALQVAGGTAAAGAPVPAAAASVGGSLGVLPLRADLDARAGAGFTPSGRVLAGLIALTLLLHGGLWAAERLRGGIHGGAGRAASSRAVRSALRNLERAGRDRLSKEQAAVLVEKALHEAFGELSEEDDSERARVVRGVLDEVRFVRYAPQLGDYSDAIRELAARGAAVVRRWA